MKMKAYQIKNSKHEFIHEDVFIFAANQEQAQKAVCRVNKRLRTAKAFCVHSNSSSRFVHNSAAFAWLENQAEDLELENTKGFIFEIHYGKYFS